MNAPELARLRQIPWQLFVTLTFSKTPGGCDRVPGPGIRQSMFVGLCRDVAGLGRIHFNSLLWFVRGERGEIGKRYHYHALFAGLPQCRVNERTCLAVMSCWERHGGGIARCRVFDPSLDGVSYVLKGFEAAAVEEANAYELSKFGGPCDVTISKSALDSFPARRWVGDTRIQH